MSFALGLANAYNAQHGLGRITSVGAVQLNEKMSMDIADFHDTLQHEPNNPAVTASYRALKAELLSQWNFAKSHGIVFVPTSEDPYPDSQSMIRDVEENRRLRIYTGGSLPSNHPLADTALNGTVYNVIFRGVHDLFGHVAHNNSFGATGEFRAFLAHSQMFSRKAFGALGNETLAQTSWFYYGKHLRREGRVPKKGESGYVEPRDRPYAQQKANVFGKFW